MPTLISIDPGKATGICIGHYDDETPFAVDYAAILNFKETMSLLSDCNEMNGFRTEFVVESFTLSAGNKFTADLTGVEIIGAIKYLGWDVTWQPRTLKALVPDKVLKDGGLWLTGRDVGHMDARDALDAIIHSLAYLMRAHHVPTLKKYFSRSV